MKTIGFKNLDYFHIATETNLKRDLLYFDELFIDEDAFNLWTYFANDSKQLAVDKLKYDLDEIDYLNKIGLVTIEKKQKYFGNIPQLNDLELHILDRDFLEQETDIVKQFMNLLLIGNLETNINTRIICSFLNENEIFNIKPIVEIRAIQEYSKIYSEISKNLDVKKTDVLNLVLRKMPVPSDSVSWEEIIDFKENTDLKKYRLGLMDWVNEIGNSSLNIIEIEQKLEYLLASYEDSLIKQKMKYEMGTAELIITTSLKVLENTVKLRWSEAAKTIFDLKKRNVDLLIGETKAPGREVAYFNKVNKKFT